MTELTITSVQRPSGAVLTLAGSMSFDDGPTLDTHVARLLEAKPSLVAVDLSGLTFVSSVGIAALVSLHRAVHAYGGSTRLVAPTARVFDVLDKSRIIEFMPVFPSVERAGIAK
jgi:anti-anti-sigma factor